MSGKGWAKGCLGVVVGLAVLPLVLLVFNMGVWWYISLDDSSSSKRGPEHISLTATEFRERGEQALHDTLYGLSPGLELGETGYTVEQHERRADGEPSKLSFVDRRLTARTRISAAHRWELKNGIETNWRLLGYKQNGSIWTPREPEKGPDYNFSADGPRGISVYVTLVPGPDQTLTLTMSIRADDVEYVPNSARPTSTLQPDLEDAHWSH
ncbi:hypothetical protein [Kitasatospora sp. NPDC097643]|uniref:hypothetical protein n=1 Tax=Kitasatospora sp. NPDC097643 TaxID=3157230 RepID=UPI0033320BD8